MAGVLNQTMVQKRCKYTLGLAPRDPSLTVHLFVNNFDITCQDVPHNYTECTLAGYSAIHLDPTKWNGGVVNCVDTQQYESATPIVYNFTGTGQTVYGYFVTDDTDGTVAWAELFAVPYVAQVGVPLYLTLQFVDQQCPP